ncbi:nuclear transport factor 2 family protein [Salarchaeum japonicum]|uniref:Nuclear transport factor 2 family protein n=1 Tax=Salarchaeum japonicum TaxID=555573 RepID=A0AAV3T3S3_9EURY|nr:hypothetical protein [Salarchaeum japonicum]
MRRRTVLAAAAGTLATGLAGCSDSTSDAPSVTDTTAAETTTEATTTASASDADAENTPDAVARAFYEALIAGNVERANALAHPETPSSNLPVTEESVPTQEVTIDGVEVVERTDGAAAVDVALTIASDDGTPRQTTETVGLRTHDGDWRIWRNDNCTKVDC